MKDGRLPPHFCSFVVVFREATSRYPFAWT
jgi:hypothetical protein